MKDRFRAFGLEIESEMELPDFLPGDASTNADVTIKFGPVADAPDDATKLSKWARVSPDGVWLTIDPGDRFHVHDGNTITIDSAPNSSDAERLVYLISSAFGALLKQRSLLTLHCGAVRIGDGIVGLTGQSGVGKSTTTIALVEAGNPFVTDDILAVDTSGPAPIAIPGFPYMHMCRDILERRGTLGKYPRIGAPWDKYRVPVADFAQDTAPLRGIYVLQRAEADLVRIGERLTQGQAFTVLENEMFRRRYGFAMGRRAEVFSALTAVAASVPVYVVERPAARESFDELVDTMIEHLGC